MQSCDQSRAFDRHTVGTFTTTCQLQHEPQQPGWPSRFNSHFPARDVKLNLPVQFRLVLLRNLKLSELRRNFIRRRLFELSQSQKKTTDVLD